MRLRLLLVLALVASFALAGSGVSAAPEPILVGVVISDSGPSAPLGVPQKNSFELVEKQVNAAGGVLGRPIHFEIVDDEAKPDVAAQLAQQLIGKGAVAIMCGTRTATSAAAVRVTTGANVLQFFFTPTTELWKTPKGVVKTVFQAGATADDEAVGESKFVKEKLGAKSVAILHDENQYGVGAAESTVTALKAMGVTVGPSEAYPGDATDFTPQWLRIKNAKPDVVFLIGATNTPALAAVQARTLGIKVPIVETSAALNPAFLRVYGAAEGDLYADANFDFTYPDAVAKKYIADYVKAYHVAAVSFGAFANDAARMLIRALEKTKGKSDGLSLANALETMGGFHGTAGTYHYSATDHNGLTSADVHMAKANKGVWFMMN